MIDEVQLQARIRMESEAQEAANAAKAKRAAEAAAAQRQAAADACAAGQRVSLASATTDHRRQAETPEVRLLGHSVEGSAPARTLRWTASVTLHGRTRKITGALHEAPVPGYHDDESTEARAILREAGVPVPAPGPPGTLKCMSEAQTEGMIRRAAQMAAEHAAQLLEAPR